MIEVYKYLHGMYSAPYDRQSVKESCDIGTERTQLQIVKETLSLAVETSVLLRSSNCLPEEVVSTPSLNAFKGRLDKFWDDCQFSLDPETVSRT